MTPFCKKGMGILIGDKASHQKSLHTVYISDRVSMGYGRDRLGVRAGSKVGCVNQIFNYFLEVVLESSIIFFFYLFLLNYYTFTRSEVIKFYHLSVESSVGTIISLQPVMFQTLTDETPCTELHSPFIRVCLCINPV